MEHGVLIEGESSLAQKVVREELLVQSQSDRTPVTCSDLRRSSEVDYTGSGLVRLLKSVGENELEVARFNLKRSGTYTVILLPKADSYEALVIPTAEVDFPKGAVLMVNTTVTRLMICESGARPLVVNPGKSKIMYLGDASESTCHLTAHLWKNSLWKPVFQKPFALSQNARSVLIFYHEPPTAKLRFQLFSGF